MAISPETQYPGKINPSNAEYPHGSARNITVPGDGTGTPWEAAIVNDDLGFKQALLQSAGKPPSGNPDTAVESQYLQALNETHALAAPDLTTALARTDAQADLVILVNERVPGGAAALWQYVATSSVVPNTYNVVQCTGVPTLSLVLRDSLVASAWGAIGGYVADDSAVLNALIDYADGREITLDKPEYRADLNPATATKLNLVSTAAGGTLLYPLSGTTTLSNMTYVRMTGVGVDGSLQPNGTAPALLFLDSSNIKIKGGEWRNSKRGLLQVNGCNNVVIRGCYLHDSGQEGASPNGVNQGDAVDVYNSFDVTVEECRIEDIWQIAIFVFNDGVGGVSENVTIRNNHCLRIHDNGIRCQPEDPGFSDIRKVTIEGNYLDTVTIDGIRANGNEIKVRNNTVVNVTGVAIKTEGGSDVVVSGNTARDCGRGIGIRQLSSTQAVYNWQVIGNNIARCGVDGISIARFSGTLPIENVTITDNILTDLPDKGITVNGSSGADILNCKIAGNVIRDTQDKGLSAAWVDGLNVTDNFVESTNQTINASGGAIDLFNCDDFIVQGNIIPDRSTINEWAVVINGDSDHGQVVNNDVRGATGTLGIRKLTTGTDVYYGHNVNKTYTSTSVYTVSNLASLKAFDVNNVSVTELARVLGTVLEDLENARIFRRD